MSERLVSCFPTTKSSVHTRMSSQGKAVIKSGRVKLEPVTQDHTAAVDAPASRSVVHLSRGWSGMATSHGLSVGCSVDICCGLHLCCLWLLGLTLVPCEGQAMDKREDS